MASKADTELDLDKAVDAVVDLSHAPECARRRLRHTIKKLVQDRERASPDDQRNVVRVFDQWVQRRLRMVQARADLRDAAIELQQAIEDYDQAYGRRDRFEEVAPPPIDRLLNEVLRWVNRPFSISIYAGEEGPGRGRPRAHRSLIHFIIALLVYLRRAGGDLTYAKNHPEKSTLVRALDILRPHLGDLVPIVLPVRALLTARSLAAAGFDAYLCWEKSDPVLELTHMMFEKLGREQQRRRNKKTHV
jgi:hypothetical protein